MKNIIFKILVLQLVTFNIMAQKDSLLKGQTTDKTIDTISSIQIGHDPSPYPPLFILDGLKIQQDSITKLKLLEEDRIKKIKIDKDYVLSTKEKIYFGAIKIYTKILFVFNDSLLEHKREKIKVLSKVKQEEIKSIKKINAEKAIEKYGKAGKHGAIIIKTK